VNECEKEDTVVPVYRQRERSWNNIGIQAAKSPGNTNAGQKKGNECDMEACEESYLEAKRRTQTTRKLKETKQKRLKARNLVPRNTRYCTPYVLYSSIYRPVLATPQAQPRHLAVSNGTEYRIVSRTVVTAPSHLRVLRICVV
jgi:hypothetical protein